MAALDTTMNWFKRMFTSRKEETVDVTPIVNTDKGMSTTSATYHLQQGRYELNMVAKNILVNRARLVEQIKEMDVELKHIQDMLMYAAPVETTVTNIPDAPQIDTDI